MTAKSSLSGCWWLAISVSAILVAGNLAEVATGGGWDGRQPPTARPTSTDDRHARHPPPVESCGAIGRGDGSHDGRSPTGQWSGQRASVDAGESAGPMPGLATSIRSRTTRRPWPSGTDRRQAARLPIHVYQVPAEAVQRLHALPGPQRRERAGSDLRRWPEQGQYGLGPRA